MFPLSCYALMALYIYTQFQKNISKSFRVIERTHTEIYKEAYFHKKVDGVQVVVHCTSSDNALYLRQVL